MDTSWLTLGCLAAQLATAQQEAKRTLRVGALLPMVDDELGRSRLALFRRRLEDLGSSTHLKVAIDARWTGDDYGTVRHFAADLVATKPDAVLALGTAAVAALVKETRTIPIVFVQVTDPVGAGFVASLSSPGGNVTGFAN